MLAESFWVERDRYHTAIVLNRELIERLAPNLIPVLNDAPWVRFGWGDWDFYGSSKKSFVGVLKALFLPTRSVVEVSTFMRLEDVGSQLISIDVALEQLQSLLGFISKTFKWNSDDEVQLVREEANGFRYYHACGVYHALSNCNNWTAKALKQSGLNMKYRLSFSASSVMRQLYRKR